MHTRLLQVMPWPDSDAPEVQAVVHFSRSWHTATMAHTGRRLVRVPNTPRWSHGGGLFRDPSSDETFTVQSLWPLTDEPNLFPDEAEDDSSPFTWRFTAIEANPTATARADELDHAERRKNARLMRRPATHPAERITIRLMPEYGVTWPLWGPDGPLEPWELALPDDLVADLRAWFDRWERSSSSETGWTDETDRMSFHRDAEQLAGRIGAATAAFAIVEVHGVADDE
ncbi:hypothetical protein ASG04_14615 [Curtobacterium sp. Leaf183]|uniref:hypothetical protein n=1 Tax=Curtobacterium sp. Leaf183 TaxID=1736291 RepID=UPI0006F8787F|nr:hypothetical protein [Curtobacterium sp. Leaf183]KQS08335.1 hypothetical protein ASG04_14615 [Curtobacterium sp. Leaf183]